jgi:hypothetical protein
MPRDDKTIDQQFRDFVIALTTLGIITLVVILIMTWV